MIQWLVVGAFLFIVSPASALWVREVNTSTSCAQRDNTWTMCSPYPGATWDIGSSQEFSWKRNNPLYIDSEYLSLYLLHTTSSNRTRVVKIWTVRRTQDIFDVQVDDTWFPSPARENERLSWNMQAYLVGQGVDLGLELRRLANRESLYPAPVDLNLIQYTRMASHPPDVATEYNPDNSLGVTAGAHTSIDPWTIGIICVAFLVIVVAALCLFWVIRRQKRKTQIAISEAPSPPKRALFEQNKKGDWVMIKPKSVGKPTSVPLTANIIPTDVLKTTDSVIRDHS